VILQSSLRDLHSCPSCSSRSHLCWFSLRSMPYGLPEEVSRDLLRFPEFICILKVDFFLIKLAFQQTLKDRILHDDSWDFGRCMLITTSCQHSQFWSLPRSSDENPWVYALHSSLHQGRVRIWTYRTLCYPSFPRGIRMYHVRQILSYSRVSSVQSSSVGTLLRAYDSVAASGPTTQLSTKVHLLFKLKDLYEVFRVYHGCFHLDVWHLSATVELIIIPGSSFWVSLMLVGCDSPAFELCFTLILMMIARLSPVSQRTSYHLLWLAFHPSPQLIQSPYNDY